MKVINVYDQYFADESTVSIGGVIEWDKPLWEARYG